MRLYRKREPKYSIKSQKALKIDDTINQSFNNSVLSFLIFGPRRNSNEFRLYRSPVKSLIERMNQVADFPEDVRIPSSGGSIAKELAGNPATKYQKWHIKSDFTFHKSIEGQVFWRKVQWGYLMMCTIR
jgi:hypothetical protein